MSTVEHDPLSEAPVCQTRTHLLLLHTQYTHTHVCWLTIYDSLKVVTTRLGGGADSALMKLTPNRPRSNIDPRDYNGVGLPHTKRSCGTRGILRLPFIFFFLWWVQGSRRRRGGRRRRRESEREREIEPLGMRTISLSHDHVFHDLRYQIG